MMEMSPAWLTAEILESITEGFVFLDREMRYVYANDAALALIYLPPRRKRQL